MKLLPLDLLGARESSPGTIQFGCILPGISAAGGYTVTARVVHSLDQLMQGVPTMDVPLAETAPIAGYEAWTGAVTPTLEDAPTGSYWGSPGQYVYRLEVRAPDGRTVDWISSPFAREFATGDLSAITLGYVDHVWSDAELTWRVPDQADLIVYELMIAEFGTDIAGVIAKLDYLRDLGVNCIEVMPVTNVATAVNWGYDPIGYFGVDERFGNQKVFKAFVDECHQRGIAVIVDMVYGHTSTDFAFQSLYYQLGLESPTNDNSGMFGPKLDFSKSLTQDIAFSANMYWLDRFHVDGIRYDEVSAYWSGPTGPDFAALAYNTYEAVRSNMGGPAPGYWSRFGVPASPNLIQVAEYLGSPDVLSGSYASACWQDQTLRASRGCADAVGGAINALGYAFVADGYPTVHVNAGNTIHQAVFQYLESHDHERLLCSFPRDVSDDPCSTANRSNWYKLQPYLIGMFTSVGVPMLWEGQEIGEDYFVPDHNPCREEFRPVHWHYIHQTEGRRLLALVRRLTRIRAAGDQFKRGDSWYHAGTQWTSSGLLLFSRYTAKRFSLVALNFTDLDQESTFPFTIGGDYGEELGGPGLTSVVADQPTRFRVPSNYGCIWTATG